MNKKRVGEIFNYLFSVALAVVFALFLSGRVGWFLVLVLVIAPIASFVLTFALRSFVRVEGTMEGYTVNKGDVVSIPISVTNKSFLPLPPIEFEIADSLSVSCNDSLLRVSVMPFSRENFEMNFKAEIAGKSLVGVGSVVMRDYLGIFGFKLKKECFVGAGLSLNTQVCVIPDITEVSAENEIINEVLEMSVHCVDSEDTTEKGKHTFGGLPGYDSREYVPGDPLKKINWKLSAKRNTLLIRLDEETESSPVAVVLDSLFAKIDSVSGENNKMLLLAQKTIEDSLGIARALYLNGCIVNYFVKAKLGWERYTINSEEDVTDISLILASYEFGEDETERIPYEYIDSSKGMAMVICTPHKDSNTEVLKAECYEMGISMVLYSPEDKGGVLYDG